MGLLYFWNNRYYKYYSDCRFWIQYRCTDYNYYVDYLSFFFFSGNGTHTMGYAKLVNEEENKHMTNISAWVFCICGLISTVSLIVTAVFEYDITAWITIITFIICLLDIAVDIGLILWDKEEQFTEEETCDGCKHLYFYNDGSADCDSPYARACLMGDKRIFKEKKCY